MPLPKQDVNTVESSATEEQQEAVTQQAEDGQQPTEETQQPQEQASVPAEVKQEGEVDERGVEWKNVAHEALRKVSELQTNLPTLLKTALQENQGQPAQAQPQYTKAQLRAFAESTADVNHKAWAYEQIDTLEKGERQREISQLFNDHTRKTQEEVQRNQATEFVAQTFPECFIRDESGKPLGWNNTSPLTRRIGEYMQNPELNKNPQGLMAAAKMAAFDLGISQNRRLQNKINQTTAQLRREQKKQLISGGSSPAGQQDSQKTKIAKLAAEYQKTGDKAIFKELIKARGLMPKAPGWIPSE